MNTTAQRAGHALSTVLTQYSRKPLILLLSGGSAFDVLPFIDSSNLSSQCTIAMLDERYSSNEAVNNFAQLTQTSFYQKAKKSGCNFIDTRIDPSEIPQKLAQRLNRQLHNFKDTHPTGKIITLQGVGADGHTAGILPFPENQKLFQTLFEGTRWVIAYNAGNKNKYPLRITTTITFFKKAVDSSIVYAVGHEKKQVLQSLCAPQAAYSFNVFPAGVVRQMKQVHIFSDIVECTLTKK